MHTHNPPRVYLIAAVISLVTSLITGVASVAWQRPTCSSLSVGSVLSNVDSYKYHEFNTSFHKNAGMTILHIDTMEPENKWVSSGTGTLSLSDGSTELFKHMYDSYSNELILIESSILDTGVPNNKDAIMTLACTGSNKWKSTYMGLSSLAAYRAYFTVSEVSTL